MEKKIYKAPQVELILIDNEISLALQSTPPAGPAETNNKLDTNGIVNNPFRILVS